MEERLHQRVIGQDEAINAVASAIRRARAGCRIPTARSAVSCSSTDRCRQDGARRALAEFLFDDEQALVRSTCPSIRRSTPCRG